MKRWIPSKEQLRSSRWLRPLAHHFDNERLWSTERGSVARAVAIGLFFGFLIPFAQILFAIAVAIVLRAHVAIAAAATLVTNPITFPPIYWAAYQLGRFLLGEPGDEAAALRIEAETAELLERQGFFEGLWISVQSAGAPIPRRSSNLSARTRRNPHQPARPDARTLIFNKSLDRSALADCGLPMGRKSGSPRRLSVPTRCKQSVLLDNYPTNRNISARPDVAPAY